MMSERQYASCGNCTLKLVTIAYRRAPWFRLVREPFSMGMRLFSRLHRIDPDDYEVGSPACRRCVRFHKTALKEKSVTFRFFNRLINPVFDWVLYTIVTPDERQSAKRYAERATKGLLSEDETRNWMGTIKVGF